MKIKRSIQNIVADADSLDGKTYEIIESVASDLADYESMAEQNPDYDVDLWCGYVSYQSLDVMLNAISEGARLKPPAVFDMSDKIMLETEAGPIEMHACSSVLVFDYDTGIVSVGRGYLNSSFNPVSLKPAIGMSIHDKNNHISDVDLIEVVR